MATSPIPTAYATKSASPCSVEPAWRLVTTIARNGAMVQVSEASAYAIPNSAMDAQERVSRGARPTPAPGAGSRRPASSQQPRASSPSPSVTVSQGSRGRSQPASGATASPKAPNTTTYPQVRPVAAVSARRTGPRPSPAPATSSDRYAGSIAKPHGLTAPSMPAVSASSSGVSISRPARRPGGSGPHRPGSPGARPSRPGRSPGRCSARPPRSGATAPRPGRRAGACRPGRTR